MCDQLLRLKMYLCLLENEGALTDSQWCIVHDSHILLKTFMIAQKLLEGQTYVTISLVPYIIYKIRKGLQEAIDSQTSTDYIRRIAAEIQVSNTHFVWGDAGTIATENLETGKRKRSKVINNLALMDSFLDSRMKGGVGLSNDNKEIIYDKIRESIIKILTLELENAQPQEQAQQQPAPHYEKCQGHQDEDEDIFDETHHSLIADNVNRVNDVDRENLVVNLVTEADAELTLYKQAPPIKLERDKGTFNCPLLWWK